LRNSHSFVIADQLQNNLKSLLANVIALGTKPLGTCDEKNVGESSSVDLLTEGEAIGF
jgi:hypothetical protein